MIESIVANVPIFVRVLVGTIAVVGVLLSLGVLVRWLSNAVRHRLPRPFLGEGSNIEWAEQKRLEIAAGLYSPEQHQEWPNQKRHDQGSGADHVSHSTRQSSDKSRGEFVSDSRKNQTGDPEEKPHRAWLVEPDHIDTRWAERLLGNQEPPEET